MQMHYALSHSPPSFASRILQTSGHFTKEALEECSKNAPKLRQVDIEAPLLHNNSLPLQQIDTLYTFGAQDLTAVLRLRAFPELNDVTLSFCRGTAHLFPLFGDLYLPIDSLSLYQEADAPGRCITEVFGLMVLPYLQYLQLAFDSSIQLPTHWPESSFGFSSLTIGGLAVDYARPDDVDELILFLSVTKDVEDLDLEDSRISSEIISNLTLNSTSSDSSPLLPVLKTLECIIGPDDHEAMFEMVLSRIEHTVPLRKLRLNTPLVLENAAKAAQ
ncbi:hypothetical protein CPB85DRAFT_196147 [Mucidula mucida]|nr:hypothetical protein CPB85DRAFT_196147 [Mucidula mucida]